MEKTKAILLLAGCKTLATKLTTIGQHIELTQADENALIDFEKVYRAGWFQSNETYLMAGLTWDDMEALDLKVAQIGEQGMQNLQASRDGLREQLTFTQPNK